MGTDTTSRAVDVIGERVSTRQRDSAAIMPSATRLAMLSGLAHILRFGGMLLYWAGAARSVIRMRGKTPRIVLYHACEPSENDFLRGLDSNVTPGQLAMHLDFYARHYNVVPVSALEGNGHPERALAITFDDGYRSVFVNALPLLRERRFPVSIYLVSEVLERNSIIWVNTLTWCLNRMPGVTGALARKHFKLPAPPSRHQVMQVALYQYDASIVRALLDEIAAHADARTMKDEAADLFASWNDVTSASEPWISFGNHTATHPNLTCLTDDELTREIRDSQSQLGKRLKAVTSFAYPFGAHDARVESAAVSEGFRSLLRVGGSKVPFDPLAIGRVESHARSHAALFADIEVVHPVMQWLRRRLGDRN